MDAGDGVAELFLPTEGEFGVAGAVTEGARAEGGDEFGVAGAVTEGARVERMFGSVSRFDTESGEEGTISMAAKCIQSVTVGVCGKNVHICALSDGCSVLGFNSRSCLSISDTGVTGLGMSVLPERSTLTDNLRESDDVAVSVGCSPVVADLDRVFLLAATMEPVNVWRISMFDSANTVARTKKKSVSL